MYLLDELLKHGISNVISVKAWNICVHGMLHWKWINTLSLVGTFLSEVSGKPLQSLLYLLGPVLWLEQTIPVLLSFAYT